MSSSAASWKIPLVLAAACSAWAAAAVAPSTQAATAAAQEQDERGGESQEEGEEGANDVPPPMEDKEAKALLKELKKDLGSKEPRIKAQAIERLRQHSNERFVDPLADLCSDRDPEVAVLAIEALATQPFDDAKTRLLKLLRARRMLEDPTRLHAALRTLAKIGWTRRGYQQLRDLFDDVESDTKKEILRAFAAQKEVRAFSLFVEHFDEPRPKSVNSPTNPPASYWKAKYQEWKKLEAVVRKGLRQITGKEFASADEAIEWSKTREARKAGFEFSRGS